MFPAPLPDLDALDPETLKALAIAKHIAVNYILNVKKSAAKCMRLTFEKYAEDITSGIGGDAPRESEQLLLIEEVKIGCTFGKLQCLDREHRLAYILGEIMEFTGPEAAGFWTSPRNCFASVCRLRALHSLASQRDIAAWCPTWLRAGVTCRSRTGCEPADLTRISATLPRLPPHLTRLAG
jgi:hypothetical protein